MYRLLFMIMIGLLTGTFSVSASKPFSFHKGKTVTISIGKSESEVVHTALDMLKGDIASVFTTDCRETSRKGADIIVRTDASLGGHEQFVMQVKDGRLYITGSEPRGTAYGLMTLSQMIGVSPWVWWADCKPKAREHYELADGFQRNESPSVLYRGIFINDEDWGMLPWSTENLDSMGPETHRRIFELLLRLKANTFWPAMHGCSRPFYLTPGNNAMARRYGIIVSTSHCEPMMCNVNGEWTKGEPKGAYDFVHNHDAVVNYWEDRVREVKDNDCIFTLGMRGVHDSKMLGANTLDEQVSALTKVIAEQREMLRRNINPDVTKVPQQFIPYKEVLECYHAGLQIPDDVTLMWCDDNYGYIRHQPTATERNRSGGNGMYYHISYWGRPHDYLWLSTTHPDLVFSELNRAYDNGVRHTWIINVGDIKPSEYLLSLIMDMAWNNIKERACGVDNHIADWYSRLYGGDPSMWQRLWREYYDLSFACRPEFLGGTRTEEKDPAWKKVRDLELTDSEINARLDRITEMLALEQKLLPEDAGSDAFQLVRYPIEAMAAMNRKMLGAQLARHGKADWQLADDAYSEIQRLTAEYNRLEHGKWKGMMDCRPRRLPVFDRVEHTPCDADTVRMDSKVLWRSDRVIGKSLQKGNALELPVPDGKDGRMPVAVVVEALPIHPTVDDAPMRLSVSVDGGEASVFDIHTVGRSETWKQNVLRNSTTSTLPLTATPRTVTVTALDDDIILQRVKLKY